MGCECSLDKLKNEVDRVIFHHELSQKINNNDILFIAVIFSVKEHFYLKHKIMTMIIIIITKNLLFIIQMQNLKHQFLN